MRVLITGAFGAVGVWTMRSLLDRGHEVVALDIGDDEHRLPVALSAEQAAAVVRVRGDVTNLQAVERVIDEHAIGSVIHLAALQVPFVRADPALGARVNVVGTINVFEAVRPRADRMGPVVYASSIAAYGAAGTLAGDDHPGTLYGVFKRDNEGSAQRYFSDFGVSSIGLRPHTVYGPGRDRGLTSAPTTATVAAAAGTHYRIPFGGPVQLQYGPDVGETFARTAELECEGASVHDLGGPAVTIAELVELLERHAPGLITAVDEPLPFPGEVDGSSLEALLGGAVGRPTEEAVADALRRFGELLAAGLVTV